MTKANARVSQMNDQVQEYFGDVYQSKAVDKKNANVPVILAPSKVLEARVWNCRCPPPVNTVKGHFAPIISSRKNRRISIEVHRILPIQARVLTNPADKLKKKDNSAEGHEEIFIRMLKPRRSSRVRKTASKMQASVSLKLSHDDLDDSSDEEDGDDLSTVRGDDDSIESCVLERNKKWKTRFKLPIFSLKIKKCVRDTCVIVIANIGKNGKMNYKTREFVFSSSNEAQEFAAHVNKCQAKEAMEREKNFKSSLGKIKLSSERKNERIKLLIDIVSAKNLLPLKGKSSSDPYIVAMLGDKEIHRTRYVPHTLNPIWTIDKQSLFILDVSIRELFERPDSGLAFFIKDYDFGKTHHYQGIAIVPPADLYNANEDRIEYEVLPLGCEEEGDDDDDSQGETRDIEASSLRKTIKIKNPMKTSGKLEVIHEERKETNENVHEEVKKINPKKEEQIISPLSNLLNSKNRVPTIAIRCRRATQYDEDFLHKCYNKTSDEKVQFSTLGMKSNIKKGLLDSERFVGQSGLRSIIERKKRLTFESNINGNENGNENENENGNENGIESSRCIQKVMHYRVRPSPDPERRKQTEWMTKEQLDREVWLPSRKWIDSGGGQHLNHTVLGSVFVEVIKCEDLPNRDVGGYLGNKTDAFVSLVYENNYGLTDVISDKLCPLWLPWSRRAFIFHMINPSSQLFLGVFDSDTSVLDDHDYIGRVTVDLTPFSPKTEYVLNYNLMDSARAGKRDKTFGRITIRLRIEIDKPTNLGLVYFFKERPACFVNVKNKKDFHCIQETVYGCFKRDTFSVATITSYIDELTKYFQHSQVYIIEAIIHIFLWRSTMNVTIYVPYLPFLKTDISEDDPWWNYWLKGFVVPLPFYSFLVCFTAFTIIDDIYLAPSYFFLWIGITLLGIMHFKLTNPDPWSRCKTFGDVIQNVVFGSNVSPQTIRAQKCTAEIDAFHTHWEEKIKEADEASEERNKALLRAREEQERENEEIGDAIDVSSKSGYMFNPLKRALYPLQLWLCWICEIIRLIKNVILWEESYISSFVTIFCFLTSIALYYVPWGFLIYWTSHIIVWALFGPWMKLVDEFYIKKLKPLTPEEKLMLEREAAERRFVLIQSSALEAQMYREYLIKLSAMKKYLFGKFMIKIPFFKQDRYKDVPLQSSTAEPIKKSSLSLGQVAVKEAGEGRIFEGSQQLIGVMIPMVGTQAKTEATVGNALKNRSLLNEKDPAAKNMNDSITTAFVKVSFILILSAVISFNVINLGTFFIEKTTCLYNFLNMVVLTFQRILPHLRDFFNMTVRIVQQIL